MERDESTGGGLLPIASGSSFVSLLRGLAILESFSPERTVLGVSELSHRLGLHKSTVSRLAAALESADFLERAGQPGRYRLGPKLARLGGLATVGLDLRRVARPALLNLVQTCGETAHLGVLEGAESVTIDFVEGRYAVRMHTAIGKRAPIYCSALGKALLAALPAAEVQTRLHGVTLQARTVHTVTTIARLHHDLEAVRRQGYAYDDQELEIGLRCIGAPIYDGAGRPLAAISISGPAARINAETLEQLASNVLAAAAEVSARLGAPRQTAAGGGRRSTNGGRTVVLDGAATRPIADSSERT